MRHISAKSAGTRAIARAPAPANENLHGPEYSDAPITTLHPDDSGGGPHDSLDLWDLFGPHRPECEPPPPPQPPTPA
jgi:hypothetical protein